MRKYSWDNHLRNSCFVVVKLSIRLVLYRSLDISQLPVMSKSQPSSTANASSYIFSLVGQRPSMGFTVNSGALTGQVGRQVLITPL